MTERIVLAYSGGYGSIQATGATVLALGLASLAAVLCGLAYVRWRSNEVAMRHDRPLPTTVAIPLVASALLVVAALVSVLARFP